MLVITPRDTHDPKPLLLFFLCHADTYDDFVMLRFRTHLGLELLGQVVTDLTVAASLAKDNARQMGLTQVNREVCSPLRHGEDFRLVSSCKVPYHMHDAHFVSHFAPCSEG